MILVVTLATVGVAISSRGGGETTATERFVVPALSMPGVAAGLSSQQSLVRAAPVVIPTTAIGDLTQSEDSETPGESEAGTAAEATPAPSDAAPDAAASPDDTGSVDAGAPDEIVTAVPSARRPVAIPYEVQPGDTVADIAGRFDLTLASVLYANPDIVDPNVLIVGQQMTLPGAEGLIYSVKLGDTLRSIAREFAVKPEEIIGYQGNNLFFKKEPAVGTHILLPGATPELPEVVLTPVPTTLVPVDTPLPSDTPLPTDTTVPVDTPIPTETPAPPTPDPTQPPQSGSGFAWPAYGAISSYFGPGHPLGIDIDMYGRAGEGIGAAAPGTVVFAGGDACCSYGLYVIIAHAKGWSTVYAHLSSISVSVGQDVGTGSTIGAAGSTGYSTGTHLHFEILKNGVHVNPLDYLP